MSTCTASSHSATQYQVSQCPKDAVSLMERQHSLQYLMLDLSWTMSYAQHNNVRRVPTRCCTSLPSLVSVQVRSEVLPKRVHAREYAQARALLRHKKET